MTELEKLEAGLEYDFWDKEVNMRKQHSVVGGVPAKILKRTPTA